MLVTFRRRLNFEILKHIVCVLPRLGKRGTTFHGVVAQRPRPRILAFWNACGKSSLDKVPCGFPEIAFSVSAYDLRCQLILLLLSHVDKCCAQASERTTFFSTTTYDSII
jgi:hypothetical protein